eukprot:snap_masked-scaffold_30-processed-gene-3.106-mRNA-1 protein AED:1.00 eAED:1.00 QI:0/-1/0/0/-1/1/1/0/104
MYSALPNIENQLVKIRGMELFRQYELLTGFDCLPTEDKGQRFFTFCTPWGFCNSFKGAPWGWFNTPSLFSEWIIIDVLLPKGLFEKNVLQWINDTVLLWRSFDE